MASSIWNGSIHYGLMTIPIKLYTATESGGLEFHTYDRDNPTDRIAYRRVNAHTENPIRNGDTVRGYNEDGGALVYISDAEYDGTKPDHGKSINVDGFVLIADVGPEYFAKTCIVGPEKKHESDYAAFAEALEDSECLAIGEVTVRRSTQLVALRAMSGRIYMHVLHYPENIRAGTDIPIPEQAWDSDLLGMARMLIDAGRIDWDPTRYRDEHTRALRTMIKAKRMLVVAAVDDGPTAQEAAQADVDALLAELDAAVAS